tara:strand:+ start:319 stop:936 length:618 start_codon:yes stop_codon:yes gene_type:complete
MKKLLIMLLCLPMIIFGQKTYVPDDNFEQALINLGYDLFLDDSVQTTSIDTVTYLFIPNNNIYDLTGIEAFSSLTQLFCYSNQLEILDLSNNSQLFEVNCNNNQLVSLDVRNNNNLALWYFTSTGNSLLNCIDVDDVVYAEYTWSVDNWTEFSMNCNPTSIQNFNQDKKLISVLDIYGRSVSPKNSMTLFYIYDDGSVEKRIVIE